MAYCNVYYKCILVKLDLKFNPYKNTLINFNVSDIIGEF